MLSDNDGDMVDEERRQFNARIRELETQLAAHQPDCNQLSDFRDAWKASAAVAKKAVGDMGEERILRKTAEAQLAALQQDNAHLRELRAADSKQYNELAEERDALQQAHARLNTALVRACEFITAEQWQFMTAGTRTLLRAALTPPEGQ